MKSINPSHTILYTIVKTFYNLSVTIIIIRFFAVRSIRRETRPPCRQGRVPLAIAHKSEQSWNLL
jgi:hypothetical protein